jgi:putative transposase
MCRVLGVSPSGYYAWRSRPESARAAENRRLLADIRRLHGRHRGRYGSPRIHAALRAAGGAASRGRVERLMRRHGIRGVAARRFRPVTTDSRHGLPVAPNLLEQDFQAPGPNRVWLADITYVPTGEGWLYLAAVLDLATRKVVGWAMREHMRTELASAALLMAVQRQRPPEGLVLHSDRGSQYAAGAHRELLEMAGMHQSMSRKGCDAATTTRPRRASSTRSRSSSSTEVGSPREKRPGASCSPTSKATTIAGACTPPSAISRRSRRSDRPLDPVSTETGDDQSSVGSTSSEL